MTLQTKTRRHAIHNLLLDLITSRFIHHPRERIERSKIGSAETQQSTFTRMLRFEIAALEGSILAKGWYLVGVPIYVTGQGDANGAFARSNYG